MLIINSVYIFKFYVDVRPWCTVITSMQSEAKHPKLQDIPRYNDNGSIALPMRCPGVSRDDKSSWKPDRFERAVARKHEAPIFPTASNQTSHVLRSAWFRARFSYSYWSPGASPSSWSPRLNFLRIRLEETINHLVVRTVRSSVSIFIWRRPPPRYKDFSNVDVMRIVKFYVYN